MGPIWGRQDPGGPHVGPMNFAIWEDMICAYFHFIMEKYLLQLPYHSYRCSLFEIVACCNLTLIYGGIEGNCFDICILTVNQLATFKSFNSLNALGHGRFEWILYKHFGWGCSDNGLVAIRQQAIVWTNIVPDLCHQLAPLGHNELNNLILYIFNIPAYNFVYKDTCY